MRRFAAGRSMLSRIMFVKPERRKPFRRTARRMQPLENRLAPAAPPGPPPDPTPYGASGRGASSRPSISADGQLVAFTSAAENLVPNDPDNLPDAFVYNRSTGTVTLVSVGTNGTA